MKKFFRFILIVLISLIVCSFLVNSCSKKSEPEVEPEPENNKVNAQELQNAVSNTIPAAWQVTSNVGLLDSAVAEGVRDKRTQIIGNNEDVFTIMVYLCGTDLESQYGMAVNDLVEMANASTSDKLNVIVYTGGAKKWYTNAVSSRYNQIIKIEGDGNISYLVENAGTGTMLDTDTLTSFIEYCADNFEANRYGFIFWDHGGGSISGYGYDEKFPDQDPLSLTDIDKAFTDAGVKFDFVGFDACLMATTETAIMLSEHADYLIGSEESEPGIGWYYTDWLSKLAENTSMPTIQIGKNIADDFIYHCERDTEGESGTLSVIDLAEAGDIIPDVLSAFSDTTNSLIDEDYTNVAYARGASREFASDSMIDMVDLVDMASNLKTDESMKLVNSLMSAIKYNNTTIDMTNSYGLSIYFPYRTTYYVSDALSVYDEIGMSQSYSDCIRNFASYTGAGQISNGGYSDPFDTYDYTYYDSYDDIYELLYGFLSGSYASDSSYYSYYNRGVDKWFNKDKAEDIAKYLSENHFDGDLTFKDGKITLSEKQWSLIDEVRLNMFIDDGEGYVELGKDALFEIDEEGSLIPDTEKYWLGASTDKENWQPVAYYHLYRVEHDGHYDFSGRIPVLLNGEYVNLITLIDDENMKVIGAYRDYKEDTDLIGKNLISIKEGDEIEFVCDYYDYDGEYNGSYVLGDKVVVKDEIYLGDIDISDYELLSYYEFKDIYQQAYYSSVIR